MKNKESIYPPIGMCGEIPKGMPENVHLFVHTPYEGQQKINGNLSIHNNPIIPIRFLYGNKKSDWINAMIDTGSFYSLAKRKIFDSFGLNPIGYSEADMIEDGNVLLETYACGFQIASLQMAFSTLFPLLKESFQYDAIIGSHIFDIADLHIHGKEKTFELIFR